VVGRSKAYEMIVKGENIPRPNLPESFNVLIHELRGLGLEVTLK
jgi:DNA-directed RNA polymerase subunit beta